MQIILQAESVIGELVNYINLESNDNSYCGQAHIYQQRLLSKISYSLTLNT